MHSHALFTLFTPDCPSSARGVSKAKIFPHRVCTSANRRNCSLKLKSFQKFDSAATALEEVASLVEGKVTPRLASLLDEVKDEKKVSLAVADPKLGMWRKVVWKLRVIFSYD